MPMRVVQLRGSDAMLGAERVVLELARESRHFGVESVIVAPHEVGAPTPELVERARAAGIRAEVLPCRGRFDPALFRHLRRFLRSERIDLLHCHGYKEDFYGLLSAPGIPVVANNHLWKRTTPALRLYCWLDGRLLRYFDQVIAVSGPIHRELLDVGVPPHKLARIANGIDTTPFRAADEIPRDKARARLGLPRQALIVGMVSSLTMEKGHRYALQALARLASELPSLYLAVVGDGPERAALQAMAEALELRDRISFCGRHADIPAVLRTFDLFLLPSLSEGLPIALLEAMASALPVVASAVGDVPEVVEDGVSGSLVPAGDADALTEALRRLLTQPERLPAMGAAARRRVETHYSAREMARQYCQLYERLLRPLPAARGQEA